MAPGWQLVRLQENHPVDAFTCGTRPGTAEIDKYLREHAPSEQAARLASVWVVEDTETIVKEERLVAFYTLSPVIVRLSGVLMEKMNINAPYQTIGGWLLGRMGIAERHQGHEYGRVLVASAIRMAKELSHEWAGPLLAVDPANESLVQWYLNLDFGFHRLAPTDPRILRLALKL